MIQDLLYKILMAPFSLLFGLGVSIVDLFYKAGLLKSVRFDIPVISVGNLSVGGAGKTPHVEYLVRFLSKYIKVATLSRGYKRKTRGYLEVRSNSNALEAGDEPVQYKKKFSDVMVAVAEERTLAIPQMLIADPGIQTILLDDAFQHRSVKPGLNILLTDYNNLFTRDFLLPSGRLREWRSAYKRADRIVVTKCPNNLSPEERQELILEIRPEYHQKIFFSTYKYLDPYSLFNPENKIQLGEDHQVLVICAIANTDFLMQYLGGVVEYSAVLEFEDHHYFNESDITKLQRIYKGIEGSNKIILTTEKDATRLNLLKGSLLPDDLPIFVLPIEVQFLFDHEELFLEDVKEFLLNFKV